jgi:hypothetical protein
MNEMLENIPGRFPQGLILICTILSFVIPYIFYKVNSKLHEHGDPPWKKNEQE